LTERIHIVGLGLVGGSMARGLAETDWEVTGWDAESSVRDEALRQEVVADTHPPAKLPEGIDVLVMAVPVPEMPAIVEQIAEGINAPRIITDVGSTKEWLFSRVTSVLPEGTEFVGAHPMAGSEESGFRASDPLLFENAISVVTPSGEDAEAAEVVGDLWERLGAHVMTMDPGRHDRVVARVSHLPHITAAALVHAVRQLSDYEEDALPLAAGGFRDTTRVAEGDPDLWRDIFETNKDRILEALSGYETILNELKSAFSREQWGAVEKWLQEARETRSAIPSKTKGILGGLHELRIQAPDRPGILSEVTGILADASINICDIEVLRVREGEMGTIRLGFRRSRELEQARHHLEQEGEDIEII
jgi:prephenate dehydrogenase